MSASSQFTSWPFRALNRSTSMSKIRTLGHVLWLKARLRSRSKRHFYFLSTGRVGTLFFSRALDLATNGQVYHQPKPKLLDEMSRVVETFVASEDRFRALRVEQFPHLERQILRQRSLAGDVYGDTLNTMFPFGLMLHDYLGPDRLRLVHLIRDPRSCGRSILKAERDDFGYGRFHIFRPPAFLKGLEGAEAADKAAAIWNNINGMIKRQFELIDDQRVCKTIRLEDLDLEMLREVYDFLELDGFDADALKALMEDRSQSVRHSHVAGQDLDGGETDYRRKLALEHNPDATPAELDRIERLCAPLAAHFGYGASSAIRPAGRGQV